MQILLMQIAVKVNSKPRKKNCFVFCKKNVEKIDGSKEWSSFNCFYEQDWKKCLVIYWQIKSIILTC